MMRPTAPTGVGPGPIRVGRALVVAALCTLLTAVRHLAAGGAVPDLTRLVLLFPLLAAFVVAVAAACRGALGTLAVLGVGQLGLHLLMQGPAHEHHGAAAGMNGTAMLRCTPSRPSSPPCCSATPTTSSVRWPTPRAGSCPDGPSPLPLTVRCAPAWCPRPPSWDARRGPRSAGSAGAVLRSGCESTFTHIPPARRAPPGDPT